MCISLISVFNSENAMQGFNMVIVWLEPSLKDSAACVPTTPRMDKSQTTLVCCCYIKGQTPD